MSRSFTFLVDPRAGGGAPEIAAPVARRVRQAGARVDLLRSPGLREIRPVIEDAVAAGNVVVAVGGDRTLTHLAGTVAELGGTLGIVRGGHGNGFARTLGIPEDPAGQARVLLYGEPRRVDLLGYQVVGAPRRQVTGSVYAGVDARAAGFREGLGMLPAAAQYPAAAMRALATYQPQDFAVAVDGEWRYHRAGNVVVANSAYYGAGMKVAPTAEPDDGLLDVVVFGAAGRFDLMRSLPMLYDGSHLERDDVEVFRGRTVELRAGAGEVPVGADGEPLGSLPALESAPARIDVVPDALPVLVPGPGVS